MTSGDARITWEDSHLYAASPSSDFELCLHGYSRSSECPCRTETTQHKERLFMRASSQRLYYRLASILGPYRSSIQYYPMLIGQVWRHTLEFIKDGSRITVHDYLGSAMAEFVGNPEASDSALDLVNFLCSAECPSRCEDIVAGAQSVFRSGNNLTYG